MSRALVLTLAGVALLCLLLPSCSAGPPGPGRMPEVAADACLVIDTDVAADDIRAIAMLAASRKVKAMVTTGGGTRAGVGAAILRRVFEVADRPAPAVLVGRDSAQPDPNPADAAFRDRSEHPFGAGVMFAPALPGGDLRKSVAAAVSGCGSVTLVVLGPWTTVPAYLPVPELRSVVAQGRPDRTGLGRAPVSWNCSRDNAACGDAQDLLSALPIAWIDESSDTDGVALTENMLVSLPASGFGGAVRAVALADAERAGWRGLWDDLVALAILRPDLFRPVGTHVEPAADKTAIAAAWTHALGH